MDDLTTVSEVTKNFGVSARMLRYYEQAGLMQSGRMPGYAYRVYDEQALRRLRKILLLRRLRIPLRQIRMILESPAAQTAVDIFEQQMRGLGEEIDSLSALREILRRLTHALRGSAGVDAALLGDDQLIALLSSIPPENTRKEDKPMDAFEKPAPLKDVRILYLPPATVAAAHYIGDDPEYHVNQMIDSFVRESGLPDIKPDLRHFGFNHPNPKDDTGFHGYEMWVTIPDDMELPSPLEKKHFPGGLYAASTISMGNFQVWGQLFAWASQSDKYEYSGDMDDQEHMCGLLEEHLNYISHVHLENTEPEDMQLDLLMPVREK